MFYVSTLLSAENAFGARGQAAGVRRGKFLNYNSFGALRPNKKVYVRVIPLCGIFLYGLILNVL